MRSYSNKWMQYGLTQSFTNVFACPCALLNKQIPEEQNRPQMGINISVWLKRKRFMASSTWNWFNLFYKICFIDMSKMKATPENRLGVN